MTTEIRPMPVAQMRRLMEAPAVKPPPGEEQTALLAWRLLTAGERGRETGRLLGQILTRGTDR
jgi:hypothetical protein